MVTIKNAFFLFLISALVVISCKKTETVTINVQEPTAKFSVMITQPFGYGQWLSSAATIDSNFYFRNTSDSGAKITYRWNFGDGTTSAEKNPKHSYPKRGIYSVTLTVSNDNKASATSQQTLSASLGQQYVSFGDRIDLSPLAIEETAVSEFVLLGSIGFGSGTYFLVQLDSLLKQRSIKMFPSNYRLTSMKACDDGNFVFTGSTQSATNSNELMKMKADGTPLWNKTFSTNDNYSYATQTPDGGYIISGIRTVIKQSITYYNTIVIKTDNNGNLQWQKLLDQEGMNNTKNAVVEQDGIVVAGIKRGSCFQCDSILIVKLNNSGNVVWKNAILGGLNNSTWWDTRVLKLKNGNYAATNGYTRGIFFFSSSGEFLDRKLANFEVTDLINASDGNLLAAESEIANGDRLNVTKLGLDGIQQWIAYIEGGQKLAIGTICCASSWPVTVQLLHNGGSLVSGYRMYYDSIVSASHSIIVLLELDEAGKPK